MILIHATFETLILLATDLNVYFSKSNKHLTYTPEFYLENIKLCVSARKLGEIPLGKSPTVKENFLKLLQANTACAFLFGNFDLQQCIYLECCSAYVSVYE